MAEARPQRKPLYWVGSSRRDIRELPDDVKDVFGFALHQAQLGEKHIDAKPLRGFAGGVLEIRADDEGNTFRAVYAVRFRSAVYVLPVFHKKGSPRKSLPRSLR